MKKSVKIIALCLSLMLLTVFFTGCDFIDELRANHAILSDDKETISFDGKTYRKLPETADLYSSNFYSEKFDDITLTDDDVPVLLAEGESYTFDYDSTRDIFNVYMPTDKSAVQGSFFVSYVGICDYENVVYYCNEKDYDKYSEAIKNNKMDRIGFEYDKCDDYYNCYCELDVASEKLSNEIIDYIVNPEKMDSDLFMQFENSDFDVDYLSNTMYKCDADGVIANVLDGSDIFRDNDGNAYYVNSDNRKAVKLSAGLHPSLKMCTSPTQHSFLKTTSSEAATQKPILLYSIMLLIKITQVIFLGKFGSKNIKATAKNYLGGGFVCRF